MQSNPLQLYLMRSKPGLYCYAPFHSDGSTFPHMSAERDAFDFEGRIYGNLEKNGGRIGDVVQVITSLAWSDRVKTILEGFRFAPTIRIRPFDVMQNGKLLATFRWALDFGRYDVLNRELSEYESIAGTRAVLGLQKAVVDEKDLPPFDVWGSMYSSEFFVIGAVKKALADAKCTGFTFRDVFVNR
jgi:hypothetical protein